MICTLRCECDFQDLGLENRFGSARTVGLTAKWSTQGRV